MSALVLVLNAGSSSLKYQLLDADSGAVSASGIVERIGEPGAKAVARHTSSGETTTRDVDAPDHHAAMRVVLDAFATDGPPLRPQDLYAVGHRVVHGCLLYTSPSPRD